MRHFQALELKLYLESGATPLLLDVRELWEYEICHLPDSILLPMGQIGQRFSELDSTAEIVVICHHGIRSRQVALWLEHYGFHSLINLQGGIDAWARTVDPQMPTY
jgi:rhodanese-related sulfurtransferase